jgi:hypothetical protein
MSATNRAEQSAEWIIEQIRREAELQDDPLSDMDLDLLRTPLWEMMDTEDAETWRFYSMALNNRVVRHARAAMERAKAEGKPTEKVRRGLRLPVDWNRHYLTIYHSSDFDWIISGIMQNAILANPVAGESRPWRSK